MLNRKSFVPVSKQRIHLARHLFGEGIEIGALHRPLLPLPEAVKKVRYVDRKTKKELRQTYKELEQYRLVNVDIIGKAENLEMESASQDFIIANHLIEHTEGTFQTLENFCRILRPGGILFMAVPDKRYTFDRFREPVSYEHLLHEYKHGFITSRREHYTDWVNNVNVKHQKQDLTKIQREKKINQCLVDNQNIHFHTWRFEDFLDHVYRMYHELNIPLKVIDVGIRHHTGSEFIIIFQKQ